jgi:SAM-dependent methyltransferase
MVDARTEIYRDLHDNQLSAQETETAYAADLILDIVLRRYPAASILDVGCGLGTWLKIARQRGVADTFGIEGPWVSPNLETAPAVQIADLEHPFDLGRRFDLVISLEVGEHLSAAAAEIFVASLTRHAPVVLFSAAVPGQGGHHHVNERFLSYWNAMFEARGYRALDVIRGSIWNDRGVFWWLRQNVVLFAAAEALERHPALGEPAGAPLSIVHPELYIARLKQLHELQGLRDLLAQGGSFQVTPGSNGKLRVTRQPS